MSILLGISMIGDFLKQCSKALLIGKIFSGQGQANSSIIAIQKAVSNNGPFHDCPQDINVRNIIHKIKL